MKTGRPNPWYLQGFVIFLFTIHYSLFTAQATQLPSLFRGVVVAADRFGVRVVSVEEASQAYQADLRPEDIIVQIDDVSVASIDAFATISQALKGQTRNATVLVLRNGHPLTLTVHLYSYPILRQWGLSFVPDHDIRFAQADAGVDYWLRMARGYQSAGDSAQQLNALLNALHTDASRVDVAGAAAELLLTIAQTQLTEHRFTEGLTALQHATRLLEHLFDHPLSSEQLQEIKDQLASVLRTLQAIRNAPLDK